MNETIFTSITTGIASLVNDLFTVWGRGLGASVVTTATSWILVEQFTPSNWPKKWNVLAALIAGMGLNMLAHLSGIISFGTPFAAAIYGLIGGALAPTFHQYIGKPYLTRLTIPNPEGK